MSSSGRVDALRERHQDLLNQLTRQREKLERASGRGQSRKRDREDEAEERRQPEEETVTRTGGGSGAARTALLKPTVRFADACERQTGVSSPPATSTHGGTAHHADPSDALQDDGDRLRDTRPHDNTKSCLVTNREEQREEQSGGSFQSDECEEIPASDRHRVQPLLGYDWIAGILDAEDTFIERPDEFFNDLRIFRSLYKNDCVHSPQAAAFSAGNPPGLAPLIDKDGPEANTDTHQCTFSYRINSRLFPVPLHSQECCPVCKKHKSSHPHTASEPALVRVSIPRSTLLPPHKYNAHRRCSFDPSDSLGLPAHCLSGWSHTGQSTLPPPSSLDLRSSLNTKSSSWLQNKELEDHSVHKVPGNQIADQLSNVSRLACPNFQHISPKKKLGSTSYPVC